MCLKRTNKSEIFLPQVNISFKLDFKGVSSCLGALGSSPAPSVHTSPEELSHQQFNIFPAIFSRQLNFNACPQSKTMMDELRPNLVGVGNLLGVSGLLDDHHGHLSGVSNNIDKTGSSRKCNSTSGSSAEDFNAIYGNLPHSHEHHGHTPAHTPPTGRTIADNNGMYFILNLLNALNLRVIMKFKYMLDIGFWLRPKFTFKQRNNNQCLGKVVARSSLM